MNIIALPARTVNAKVEQVIPTDSRLQVRNEDGSIIYVFG